MRWSLKEGSSIHSKYKQNPVHDLDGILLSTNFFRIRGLGEDFPKDFWVDFSEVREDLAIKSDIVCFEGSNKFGIRGTVFFEVSAHADVPETAEITFLVSSVSK